MKGEDHMKISIKQVDLDISYLGRTWRIELPDRVFWCGVDHRSQGLWDTFPYGGWKQVQGTTQFSLPKDPARARRKLKYYYTGY